MRIRRISASQEELSNFLRENSAAMRKYQKSVEEIGDLIKAQGNSALFDLTRKYDGAKLDESNYKASSKDIETAYTLTDSAYLEALRVSISNIRSFHTKQMRTSWMEPDVFGNILGQIYRPLERAGVYVPGGTAAYPSSVLMNAIPAQVAGVKEIAMVSPPDKYGKLNPYTLVAAAELGLTEIYKLGGAQAVFALGWGTETIKKVDIISGPGNIYVTLAKKMVYGDVNIDMLAGPSEILIVADENANPKYIAADLLSQAEHDALARSILVCNNEALLDIVETELAEQIPRLTRKDIILQALEHNGAFILTESLEQSCRTANKIAPEHLELMVEQPFSALHLIRNAGAIFLGPNTPEPVGDYYAGPNHILPTGGTARFYSPVTADTFRKASSIIYYSKAGLKEGADKIVKLAEVEGLTAHANAIRIRGQHNVEC